MSEPRIIKSGEGFPAINMYLDGTMYARSKDDGSGVIIGVSTAGGSAGPHAATHGAGGSDQVSIDAATQITGSLPMLQVDPGVTDAVIFATNGGALDGAAIGAANTVLKSTGPTGTPAFSKIVNADVDAAAGIAASKISGLATVATSGSAADLGGTLADARLSSNVALKNTSNTFTENQVVSKAQNGVTSVQVINTTSDTTAAAQVVWESDPNAGASNRRMRWSLYSEGHSTGLFAGKGVLTTDNVPRILFTLARGSTTGVDEDFGFTIGTTVNMLYLIRKETSLRRIASFFSATPTDTGGDQVIYVANAVSAPSSNPSSGGVVYFDAGVLKVATPSASNNLNFTRQAAITAPTGGATVDAEARTAINTIRSVLSTIGLTA